MGQIAFITTILINIGKENLKRQIVSRAIRDRLTFLCLSSHETRSVLAQRERFSPGLDETSS
jgi:hypothetical protein